MTPRWQRYQSPVDLHVMLASNMGVAPIPVEIETLDELRSQLRTQRVVGDDEPDEAIIDMENVLDTLASDGC